MSLYNTGLTHVAITEETWFFKIILVHIKNFIFGTPIMDDLIVYATLKHYLLHIFLIHARRQ